MRKSIAALVLSAVASIAMASQPTFPLIYVSPQLPYCDGLVETSFTSSGSSTDVIVRTFQQHLPTVAKQSVSTTIEVVVCKPIDGKLVCSAPTVSKAIASKSPVKAVADYLYKLKIDNGGHHQVTARFAAVCK